MIPCLFSLVAIGDAQIYCRHFSFSWLKASSSNNDASVDMEKSQLAAIRSEITMFESSGKRGCALELI